MTDETPKPTRRERRAAAAAARPETQEAAAPAPQPRRVFVVYVHEDAEGFDRHDRVWIDGMVDLRSLDEVLNTELTIAKEKGVKNVRITNWKPLEA